MLGDLHHRAIGWSECTRMLPQRGREALASAHRSVERRHEVGHSGANAASRDGKERLVERHPAIEEQREVARHLGDLVLRGRERHADGEGGVSARAPSVTSTGRRLMP
jgi:hypothetical protein